MAFRRYSVGLGYLRLPPFRFVSLRHLKYVRIYPLRPDFFFDSQMTTVARGSRADEKRATTAQIVGGN